ncbi:MAG: UDP-N-acetylmuramoyl-tripeptide--D-alanyl-D-alanine ligase [Acidimicrobiia bacterium]
MNAHPIDLDWSLSDLASVLRGDLIGDPVDVIKTVGIDSRELSIGSLFVAIAGERFDGHDFVSEASSGGATGFVVERGRSVGVEPRIEVDSTLTALRDLAAHRRDELAMPVVAITGSTGKTSTKDLVAAGIPGSWASPRSFNNEVGVPLTVLGTPGDATVLIVEVGSRGAGHIRWLAPVIRPDVAVVTNLGVVHLETFGSVAGLADAKFELIESLTESGIAVIPSNESRLERGSVRTLTFGDSPADVEVTSATVEGTGLAEYILTIEGAIHAGSLAMVGSHQPYNLAAGAAVALALGIPVGDFLRNAASATGSDWRMDVHVGTFTVVNDAYNANPQSVEAALRTVASMEGRPVAVLGPMAELGSVCETSHRAMGAIAAALDFAAVIVVGPDHGYGLGASERVVYVNDIQAARDTLATLVEPGDVVLVKASRSAGFERLASTLIEEVAQ